MKVKGLHINDYNQFKDFSLDLTYPAGHPKAGQPLDKVCIIGQSGTGKTSLLRVVVESCSIVALESYSGIVKHIINGNILNSVKKIDFEILNHPVSIDIIKNENEHGYRAEFNPNRINNYTLEFYRFGFQNFLPPYAIFLSAHSKEIENYEHNLKLNGSYIINLGVEDIPYIWNDAKVEIISYREKYIQKSLEIVSKGLENNLSNQQINSFQEWLSQNPNPLVKLADRCLNPILNHFNLKVRTELDFEKKEDIERIQMETLDGKPVPFDLLSTGARQIIFNALPLYVYNLKDRIILFDEPERSLYPDIQTKIVDFYTGLAPDCQFFFATHSPIVASCFEPWEIVELKFREDGTVYRELYYDPSKENHVDNYFINPQYLRWDSILTRIFDLDVDANPERTVKLMELATLRSKIKKLNGHATPEEKQKLMAEFEKLANLLDWEFDEKN